MTEQQMKAFVAVAESGSFSKAEYNLFLSKQAIKNHIDTMEKDLDFALLVRSHQGVSLTPAGQEMYQGIKRLLAEMGELVERSRKLSYNNKIIRIENPNHPRLMLEKTFMEFSRLYPGIKMEVIMESSDHFVDDLLTNRADVVECIQSPLFMRPGVAFRPMFQMPYRCLMSSNHVLSRKKQIELNDLKNCRVVLRSHDHKLWQRLGEVPGIDLESIQGNTLQNIYNICNNNGILISKAFYLTTLKPFVAIPLDIEATAVAGVLYREKPSALVQEFLNVIDTLYPIERTAEQLDKQKCGVERHEG